MTPEEILVNLHKVRDFKKDVHLFSSPEMLQAFINFMKRDDYPYPEYSSWMLSHVAENHPQFLYKSYFQLIDVWMQSTNHSLHRNLLKAIALLPFKPYEESAFLDQLIYHLGNPDTKVAVKAHALTLLEHFIRLYPELKQEIYAVLDSQIENATPALKARARMFKKKMDKITV